VTVSELIAKLQNLPSDAKVFVVDTETHCPEEVTEIIIDEDGDVIITS
jgi:DNA polymerase elongation subunit (family B)